MGVNVGIVLDAEHPPERTKSIPKKKGLIDLVIDTDLPTPFCILLGMGIVLAVIFDKVGNKNICVPFDFHQNQTIHPKIKHIVGFSRPTR